MQKLKDQGFTLVELLITSMIGVIVFGLIIMILVQNNNVLLNQSAKVSQGLNNNTTITQISDDLRSAVAILPTFTSGSATYTSNVSTLVLSIPSIDNSGNVIANTFDTIVVTKDSQDPTILRQLLYPSAGSSHTSQNKILLYNLTNMKFFYLDQNGVATTPSSAAKVNFYINSSQKAGKSTLTSSASGEINLRNN